MYKAEFIRGEWRVINTLTNAIQSSWIKRNDAFNLVKVLNKRMEKPQNGKV